MSDNYETYVVIADFVGTAENELTIKMGEEILVLQSTPEGWSEGYTSDGRQGWFPTAYARFDPVGRNDVMAQIKEASAVSEASVGSQSSVPEISVQAAARSTNTPSRSSSTAKVAPAKPLKKKKKGEPESMPFPGIRHHTGDDESSPFPGVRHHIPEGQSPFPGIRLHETEASKKEDKKKKADEKKKEKERKKKEKELKKDLRMASSGLFGVPLKASVAQEQHETNIPFIVRCCVEHILNGNNLLREGLFRISGIKTEIDALKGCFEAGVESDCRDALQKADIDAVAGVLKQYLRELPDPLFTYKNYSKFVKAATDRNLASIKSTFETLPLGHKETLLFMLGFLVKVAQYQDQNKMTETNIGIVFAPTLMKPPTDDENDEPESLKEAFFFILRNSGMLLKSEPRIQALLDSFIANCTVDQPVGSSSTTDPSDSPNLPSSSPTPPPPPPLSASMAPPPPALTPTRTPGNTPTHPGSLPPPISAIPPPMN